MILYASGGGKALLKDVETEGVIREVFCNVEEVCKVVSLAVSYHVGFDSKSMVEVDLCGLVNDDEPLFLSK